MELKATPRKSQEKLAPGMIPAVAYNKEKNVTFAIERKAFDRAFRQQGTTGLFDIVIEGGETFPALVKAVQMDKRRREAIHADFYMVTYGEPVEVSVPVHTTGKSQGEIQGGLVDVVVHSLNVIAPGPRRIPQEITVDVTNLHIGDHVTAGQIKLPEGVKLAVEPDLVVLSVLPPRLTAEELAAEQQAAQVAGMVASGELSEEAAEAVLEGDASIEEVKAEAAEAGDEASQG
ncbi:50S ribosomal protein L25/general stress protein Ctc [Deinococcus sp. S9]|uniref:50S ribosomal protein L25/general stress protein Ctc n=1 Tax=Deinococcus sp. S9 TaxID=2545754 RepID=UPI0010547304|nr:50S ribosomal protein L25/general stress protein Ctc [Deinococcus sp. S9]TDE87060.1 50S ribosomal protein L25/general stress protein Ctc [Deinococcus sp. S9]